MPHIKNDYVLRINNVLNYIRENLETPFQLKDLSSIGNFSQFHFHRIISAYLNEPLGSYIKRIRLEKGAQLLQFSSDSVTQISINVGYETLSSFSDAFSKQFGVPPVAYRKKHSSLSLSAKKDQPEKINFDFQPIIKWLPVTKVAFIRVMGSYQNESIGNAWSSLFKFAKSNNLIDEKTQLFGISYDNPEISENNKCQYNACISIENGIKPQGEIGIKEIKEGKYAIFTYKGNYERFPLIYDLIFKEWLLKSTYELREVEIFDRYLNTIFDSEPNNLLTQIHIPIK